MEINEQIPARATGLTRVIRAAGYSWAGLRYTFKSEAAFRQEIFLCLVLAPLIILLPLPLLAKLYLGGCLALILICELANTGLEVIINHVSPQYSEAAKHGKDIGSALVFVALVNLGITLLALVLPLVPSFWQQ
ncbi:MAG: diacylglycerol kinase [Proteobacteria bacterium]|nr:diacylglycerol kinase [Pseudomonadota bacterium]MBU1641202.1 diacylglycerol kinase [Pseudomonadota bacterium]